jgi:hypothetical protein
MHKVGQTNLSDHITYYYYYYYYYILTDMLVTDVDRTYLEKI